MGFESAKKRKSFFFLSLANGRGGTMRDGWDRVGWSRRFRNRLIITYIII
jgi:hypothetical protein